MAENLSESGINIDKLNIDIDVSSEEAKGKTDSFKNSMENLDKTLRKNQETIKKTDDFYSKWSKAIQKTGILISSTMKVGGKQTSVYGAKINGMYAKYKLVNGELASITTKQEKQLKQTKKLDGLLSSVKRVAKYRAISAAISLFNKGITVGVKNVALFDEKFNSMMSNFKSKINQSVNSLGSISASFISTFEPIITFLLNGLSNVLDYFNQIMAVISGESSYRKAIKNTEDFANGIKKAYSGIGIDELNVFGEKDKSNYQMVEVSERIKNQAKMWEALGKAILAVSAAVIFYNSVVSIAASANALVMLFSNPIGQIFLLISAIALAGFTIAAFKEQIESFFDKTKESVDKSINTIQEKTWNLFGVFGLGLIRTFETIKTWINLFLDSVKNSLSMIGAIFRGDWKGFFESWKKYWSDLFSGLLDIILRPIYGAIDTINFLIGKLNDWFNLDIKQIPTNWFSGEKTKNFPSEGFALTPTYGPTLEDAGLSSLDYSGTSVNADSVDYSAYFSEIVNLLGSIRDKNTNIVLADDQVGRANSRYVENRGLVLNGGDFANAY